MSLKFLFPIDGDFVNSREGNWQGGALYIDVMLAAEERSLSVCGIPAVFDPALGCYTAQVPLYGYRNRITAKTDTEECGITVFVTPEENLKKYRLSSDDNIRF